MSLTKKQLNKVSDAVKQFSDDIKWRRTLTPCEKRVKFVEIKRELDSAEMSLVSDVSTVLKRSVDKIVADVEKVLDAGDLSKLEGLKVGYHGKLVNIIKNHLIRLFLYGQKEVFQELGVDGESVRSLNYGRYFEAKSEAYVTELEGRLKARAILNVLAGVSAGRTNDEITKSLSEKIPTAPVKVSITLKAR